MKEILRFMPKRDERTDGQMHGRKAFYKEGLPLTGKFHIPRQISNFIHCMYRTELEI